MRSSSLAFVSSVGIWTAVTLSGSIYLLFRAVVVTGEIRHFRDDTAIMFFIFLFCFAVLTLIGGGLWGAGIAWLTRSEITALGRTGARIWSSTAIITGFALGLSQTPIMALARAAPVNLHMLFTIEFALAIGLVTTLNIRTVLAKLGWEQSRLHVARYIGLVAALGFLSINLIMWFGYGWEVGRPISGRFSMVTITNLGNLAAALTGGIALGWTLLPGKRA